MVQYDRLDLNLLRVFIAVMEERSVIKAAQRLYLSQSAVSHALSRLKESLGEEIFVGTSKGMSPTAFALEISHPIQEALERIGNALALAASDFDPSSVERTFVIAANDYVSAIAIPWFSRYLSRTAPKIRLVIRPSTRIDLAEQIDLGRIDIAIGTFRNIPERLRSSTLMRQDDVLVIWDKHPLAAAPLQLSDLARYPLAVVSLGGQEDGAVSGFILERGLARQSEMYDRAALEDALRKIGLQPTIKIVMPHFLVIPMLLEESDLLAIVPRPLARSFNAKYKLASIDLPFQTVSKTVDAVWHINNETDPAHCWLRSQLELAFRAIESGINIDK